MAVLYRSRADTKQKPLMWPDCLFGVVPQPTDSRLSETSLDMVAAAFAMRVLIKPIA